MVPGDINRSMTLPDTPPFFKEAELSSQVAGSVRDKQILYDVNGITCFSSDH